VNSAGVVELKGPGLQLGKQGLAAAMGPSKLANGLLLVSLICPCIVVELMPCVCLTWHVEGEAALVSLLGVMSPQDVYPCCLLLWQCIFSTTR
jgi:hypothetical protein